MSVLGFLPGRGRERVRFYLSLIRKISGQSDAVVSEQEKIGARIGTVESLLDAVSKSQDLLRSQSDAIIPEQTKFSGWMEAIDTRIVEMRDLESRNHDLLLSLQAESFERQRLALEKLHTDTAEVQARSIIERTLQMVRQEYTVMPRFGFHQPLDYYLDTFPVVFDAPVVVDGEPLPLPPIPDRMGYSADDAEYLSWGRDDKLLVGAQIDKHLERGENLSILDFGCSSGRVLRHFYEEALHKGWSLNGVDIQARPIQWMRENFPDTFCVYTGSTMPILPFADGSLDVIYGFSIFTHVKFNWDMWLLELRRVLKPGGLLIQTIHTEHAWEFYYNHRDHDWVKSNHSAKMLESSAMAHDYFYYGDVSVSQVFWKRSVARQYWSRYLEVLDVLPPPDKRSFQDWMVCRKPM